MSDSVSANIFFGVVLEDEYGQPLAVPHREAEPSLSDDALWLKLTGYKPSFEIYDATGNFPNGQKPDKEVIDRYYNERRDWLKAHPIPFEVICLGSEKIEYFALIVPNSGLGCGRYEPSPFDPAKLKVAPESIAEFKSFCRRYGIDKEPSWHIGCFAP